MKKIFIFTILLFLLSCKSTDNDVANVKDCSKYKVNKIALLKYVQNGNLNGVKCNIQGGINIEVADETGLHPLYIAYLFDRIKIARYLISKGAVIDSKGELGQTPLFYLALTDNLKELKYLINKGADINVQSKVNTSVLHAAVSGYNVDIAKYLIEEKGMDVNLKIKDGFTPIQVAVSSSANFEMIKYLLSVGANKNVITEEGLDLCDLFKANKKQLLDDPKVKEANAKDLKKLMNKFDKTEVLVCS